MQLDSTSHLHSSREVPRMPHAELPPTQHQTSQDTIIGRCTHRRLYGISDSVSLNQAPVTPFIQVYSSQTDKFAYTHVIIHVST